MTHFRERAEREKEAAKNKENVDSDDEDVVFGNVLPRVKDVSKTKNTTDAENPADDDEGNDNETMDHPELPNEDDELGSNTRIAETPSEYIQQASDSGAPMETKKKRKKKKKAKRNQTAPSDDGENSDTGIVLKPIAWKTPPASLNGFPSNGRKLEPIRPPLHNNLYSLSNSSIVSEGDDHNKFSTGNILSLRPRPNEEDCDVIT